MGKFHLNEKYKGGLFMCQNLQQCDEGLVVWDYHVILIIHQHSGSIVLDLDSNLEFPVSFDEYCGLTVRDEENMMEKFHRRFRVVSAPQFLSSFRDCSSMMNYQFFFLLKISKVTEILWINLYFY